MNLFILPPEISGPLADHIAIVEAFLGVLRVGSRAVRTGMEAFSRDAKRDPASYANQSLQQSFRRHFEGSLGSRDAEWTASAVADAVTSFRLVWQQPAPNQPARERTLLYAPTLLPLLDDLSKHLSQRMVHERFGEARDSSAVLFAPRVTKALARAALESPDPTPLGDVRAYFMRRKLGDSYFVVEAAATSVFAGARAGGKYGTKLSGQKFEISIATGSRGTLPTWRLSGETFAQLIRGAVVDYLDLVEKMAHDQKLAQRRLFSLFS
jgi:hypothetical protein